MMMRYGSDGEFLRGIEGVPVTVDQWQLEKLALVTQKNDALCGARRPKEYQSKVGRLRASGRKPSRRCAKA
jgi:hypothetical protein